MAYPGNIRETADNVGKAFSPEAVKSRKMLKNGTEKPASSFSFLSRRENEGMFLAVRIGSWK